MTDPQPSCSEIARELAVYSQNNGLSDTEHEILQALSAKQKTIEEKEADLKWYAEVHEPEAIRLATESLRAEVERLKKRDYADYVHISEHTDLMTQLSRLKEILMGRDEALKKIANLEWPHLGVVDIAQQALSKTWEEGE